MTRAILLRVPGMVLAVALVAPPMSRAGDEAKHECRQGCQETLRSCKGDCRPEANAGGLQASDRYVDCDADCHSTYSACVDDCSEE